MKEVIRGARTLLGLAWRNNKPKTVLAVTLMLAAYASAPLVGPFTQAADQLRARRRWNSCGA